VRPKLIAIFLIIVFVPLGFLAWLGFELARDEEHRIRMKFHALFDNTLQTRNEAIAGVVQDLERELLQVLELPPLEVQQMSKITMSRLQAQQGAGKSPYVSRKLTDPDIATLRARVRGGRLVKQMFVMKSDGALLFPTTDGTETRDERDFLDRTRSVWETGIIFGRNTDNPSNSTQALNVQSSAQFFNRSSDHGWHPWFWGNGVNLIFWRKQANGLVAGVEVDRMAFLSRIIAELPDTHPANMQTGERGTNLVEQPGRIVLKDAQNNAIYQWGAMEGNTNHVAAISVVAPLSMWSLNYFRGDGFGSIRTGAWVNVSVALVAGTLLMIVLALYFYRENTRDIREASQRVSFVNQVSHELKTPLTNIRMYAELVQTEFDGLENPSQSSREGLGIIVNESHRLSRMISNVLTFAKRRRGGVKMNPREQSPDEIVRATLEHFRPALDAKDVEIEFEPDASDSLAIDGDFLEQILGNLFGNVEKYASDGGLLRVTSNHSNGQLSIDVSDHGPGIPPHQQEQVFEPFARLSNRLSDGVTGTGIGLTISRELARRHGGDLKIVPSESGATFRLTIKGASA
tara:strand:+ start:4675 stop:6393 length:1719 start_codon:yes stop_codon:yes gene_type:complete